MEKFLVTYHGGGMPADEQGRQQAMADFGAWVSRVGPAGGYSVLQADDIDAAVALIRDHPFVARGGSLQVSQAVSP